MLENQLFLGTGFQQDREFVEATDATRELSAVKQINDHSCLFSPDCVEKGVLNVLWCLFTV